MDPEIPAVSLIDMGIIRQVEIDAAEGVTVTITPTFSGCPALQVMIRDIRTKLEELGIGQVQVSTALSPPWSSNWITERGRQRLKASGLAPPPAHQGDFAVMLLDPAACPYCDSRDTSLRNNWGPTPCRMIFYCNHCRQPFEQFKPL